MIKSLQGLRAIAMISIYSFHSGFIPNGTFPVTLFFILSGFVIYYSHHTKVLKLDHRRNFEFGIRRIIRYYPLHFFTFLLSVFIRKMSILNLSFNEILLSGIMNLSLIHTITPKYSLSFNAVSWYLGTLSICYLFTYYFIFFLKKSDIKSLKLMIILIFSEFIMVLIAPYLFKDYSWFLYISPYYRIIDYILGMLVAKVYLENKDKLKSFRYYALGEVFVCILFVITYILSFILPIQFTRGFLYTPIFMLGIYLISFEKGIAHFILDNRYLQLIAKYGFEFYMIHELVLICFRRIFNQIECSYLMKLSLISFSTLLVVIPLVIIANRLNIRINNQTIKKCKLKYS